MSALYRFYCIFTVLKIKSRSSQKQDWVCINGKVENIILHPHNSPWLSTQWLSNHLFLTTEPTNFEFMVSKSELFSHHYKTKKLRGLLFHLAWPFRRTRPAAVLMMNILISSIFLCFHFKVMFFYLYTLIHPWNKLALWSALKHKRFAYFRMPLSFHVQRGTPRQDQ